MGEDVTGTSRRQPSWMVIPGHCHLCLSVYAAPFKNGRQMSQEPGFVKTINNEAGDCEVGSVA